MIVVSCMENRKTGPVAGTYRPVGDTCSSQCPLLGNGCYAQKHRVGMIQRRAAKVNGQLERANGAPLIRHHVSGDFLKETADGRKIVDRQYVRSVIDWHEAPSQRFTIGWTYTHSAKSMAKAGFEPDTFPENLTVLASCDSIEEAEDLQDDGWRTARVTEEMDRQEGEIYCPYDLAKHQGRKPSVNCASCRKCFDDSGSNIVFLKF